MTKEQLIKQGFEPIKHHEGYLIHRDGRVWSLRRSRFISLNTKNTGYIRVRLGDKKYLHHRLLAMQFIPNPENKPHINHINEIRDDNRLENLDWCTHKENCIHSSYKRSGPKHCKAKPKGHYETFAVTRTHFKKTCNRQGWDFNKFIEVYKGENYMRNRKYNYFQCAS